MAMTTWHRSAPDIVRSETLAVVSVIGALVLAHWWSFTAVPGITYSLWGAYFLSPLGWLFAAGVAFLWIDTLPETEGERLVERRTALMIAALIGLFLVSLQVVGGLLAELGKSNLQPPLNRVPHQLIFLAAPLLATETARCVLLRSLVRVNATLALIGTTLLLAVIQYSYSALFTTHSVAGIEFWAATFIPLAAVGLMAGFFVLYGGVRAALLVTAPLVLFTYFSPFLLIADWPIRALIGVAGPAMGLWIAESMFSAEGAIEEEESQGRFHAPGVSWVVTAVVGLAIFWFSFGFFGFRPAFIPSGSMEPRIHPGDLVLVGPVDTEEIEVGDIVMYEANPQRVLHRVIEIQTGESGKREFITKGDNNNVADLQPVSEQQIVGRYIGRAPKVGWVPLKFNQFVAKVLK